MSSFERAGNRPILGRVVRGRSRGSAALLAAVAAALACALPARADAPPDTLIWGVDTAGRVVQLTSAHPDRVQVVTLAGIPAGERVLGLDVRPLTGVLYALTSASLVYTVDVEKRIATPVSTTPFAVGVQDDRLGMDINPSTDRIRFVTATGENLRVNPATGLTAGKGGQLDLDQTPAYASDDSGAGLTPRLTALSHTNDHAGVPSVDVQVLAIDVARGTLDWLPFPNQGVLRTIGPLGLDVADPAGIDVTPDGVAFAALQPKGAAASTLYTVDVATGAATALAPIGDASPVADIAALGPAPALPPFAVRIVSVSAGKIGSPVVVKVSCTQACDASATLRLGSATVGSAPSASLGSGGSLRLVLSPAGRKRLVRLKRADLTVVVRATGADGTTLAARRLVHLRR